MLVLPIDASIPELLEQLRAARSAVLVAEPGAGKTTRVPPAILRAGLLGAANPNIVMLQPRRVAARAAAERIADENAWRVGDEVGYHVRFERKTGPKTRLAVVTEGILVRRLIEDPFLEGVGCVILDEFHERSIHTDLAIALLREIQRTVREDLLILVMSATLDAQSVSAYLAGAPVIRSPGRLFPIDIEYTPPAGAYLESQVAAAVASVLERENPGDILVFLPGAEEIRRAAEALRPLADQRSLLILPLHSSLSLEDQRSALAPARQRKVILSTNIAETSLTIEGVRTVIDSGLARQNAYDPHRGIDRLDLVKVSQASAVQRAGRAGRTAPGRCIRLWPEREQKHLIPFDIPEIHRVDLAATVLQLSAFGHRDPASFGFFERPSHSALLAAIQLLEMLGAVAPSSGPAAPPAAAPGEITPVGRQMLALPVHPRLARLLVESAHLGLAREGAAIAALLSERDILATSFARRSNDLVGGAFGRAGGAPATLGDSDLLYRLERLLAFEQTGSSAAPDLDPRAARSALQARDQLLRIAQSISRSKVQEDQHAAARGGRRNNPNAADSIEESLLKLPLAAFPDRVCKRRPDQPAAGVMVGGRGVRLDDESIVRAGAFFLALDLRDDERSRTREARIRVASLVREEWLHELFPSEIRRESQLLFDEKRDRVVAAQRIFFRDLLLREDLDAPVDPIAAGPVLAAALAPAARQLFQADPGAAALLARVSFLRKHASEHPWPLFDDPQLAAIIFEAAAGKRARKQVLEAGLAAALRAHLPYPLDRLLDSLAPERIAVPTGNHITLDYSAETPILAVRLQELFGLQRTPRIANGRIPILLHLLSPGYKPVQVTTDLESFWKTAYFQVRKDLRVRYPKHAWPEDPLTAPPVAKGRSTKK